MAKYKPYSYGQGQLIPIMFSKQIQPGTLIRKYVETLRKRLAKIRNWLDGHDDKSGRSGTPRKRDITDNASAKMKTSRGVIQGYDGVTAVDGRHQMIVHAHAFSQGQEQDLLEPMIDGVRRLPIFMGARKKPRTHAWKG